MRAAALALALALMACGQRGAAGGGNAAPTVAVPGDRQVTLTAADGVAVFGSFRPVPGAKALIVLLHQAGSSRAEYAEIAPKLNDAGYSTLAIDLRVGGELFGPNETIARLPAGAAPGYLDARRDIEAALAWAGRQGAPVILWGSSYSASLALMAAGEHPRDVTAVLAFSPGEYFDDKKLVATSVATLTMPVFIDEAKDGDEIAAAKAILDAIPSRRKRQFVPESGGVHGSSTLLSDKNAAGADENWTAVMAFLKEVSG